jgi:transitional endoplasmic reticulum ATPase
MLFGAPGTGKTLIAKAIANEAKANFITIKGPELISKWVGESEKAVREVFKKAKQASPSIVFLDEFESIAGVRRSNSGDGSDVMNRVVNQLLSSMDGIEGLEGVIVVAATNRPEMIDPALLRSGRFERVLHIPPPDKDSRKAILRIHTENMPLGRFKIDDLASKMDNYTGADIEAVCREAALIAMREEKKTVSKKHFEQAIDRVRPSVNEDMMQYYGRMESMLTSGLESVRRSSGLYRPGIESI